MKLNITKLKVNEPVKKAASVKSQSKTTKELPPDTYKPMVKERELQIADNAKLVFSVARKGDDGLPHIDIRLHVTSEQYTGLTKKGINFDCEYLLDFQEIIDSINKELDEKGV
jgi:metal-dependent HD superfamily phosphatase/phosphodiesterase